MQRVRGTAFIIILTFFATLQACVAGVHLLPKSADPSEIKGTYTLILYGCRYADDLENVAVLVDAKNKYKFEVYALENMYKVKKEVSGSEAIREANAFINCSMHTVWQTVLRRISDADGRTIAYELKPLYRPWEFKISEVLLSSYVLHDDTVTAYFTLDPSVKMDDGPLIWPRTLRRY